MPLEGRWQEIQASLALAAEWTAQIEQLNTAMGVLLGAEKTFAADESLRAAVEAYDLAYQLAHWPASEPFEFDALLQTAEQLREALGRATTMLGSTEAMGGAKDELHESLTYLYGSVVDFVTYVAGMTVAEA